jgi:hypothetical protein
MKIKDSEILKKGFKWSDLRIPTLLASSAA